MRLDTFTVILWIVYFNTCSTGPFYYYSCNLKQVLDALAQHYMCQFCTLFIFLGFLSLHPTELVFQFADDRELDWTPKVAV